MNRFEFVRNAKEIKPDIKVLLMSAFDISNSEISEHSLLSSIKVNDFVQKPISLKELYTIIQKHIPRE